MVTTVADKRFEVLSAMKDHYAHLFSRIHYLFVGNGGAFVLGLTVLKDHAATPQYRGVGIPIALFGLGFLATIVAYATLSFSQMIAKNAALDRKRVEPSMVVFWAHYGSLAFSLAAFVVALLIIIGRVALL
jgi:hypothetical protein